MVLEVGIYCLMAILSETFHTLSRTGAEKWSTQYQVLAQEGVILLYDQNFGAFMYYTCRA